jgi:hypothetical protein
MKILNQAPWASGGIAPRRSKTPLPRTDCIAVWAGPRARTNFSQHTCCLGQHTNQGLHEHEPGVPPLDHTDIAGITYQLHAQTEHLCVPNCSHNKQLLFPQTTLTGWALQRRRNVFPVRHELYLCVPYGSHNKQRLFPQTALTGWAL